MQLNQIVRFDLNGPQLRFLQGRHGREHVGHVWWLCMFQRSQAINESACSSMCVMLMGSGRHHQQVGPGPTALCLAITLTLTTLRIAQYYRLLLLSGPAPGDSSSSDHHPDVCIFAIMSFTKYERSAVQVARTSPRGRFSCGIRRVLGLGAPYALHCTVLQHLRCRYSLLAAARAARSRVVRCVFDMSTLVLPSLRGVVSLCYGLVVHG